MRASLNRPLIFLLANLVLLAIPICAQAQAAATLPSSATTPVLSPADLFQRAAKFMEVGSYRYAVGDLNRVLRADPNNVKALVMRGTAQAKLQEYDKAYLDLSSALRLAPQSAEIFDARAVALDAAGKLNEARADREQAARLRGGSTAAVAQQPAASPAPAATPITITPGPAQISSPAQTTPVPVTPPIAVMPKDVTQEKQPAVSPAVPIAPPVLRAPLSDGRSAASHYLRGRQLIGESRYQGAVAELDEAVGAQPANPFYHNARGYAYLKLHDNRRALADLDQAIRLKPDYANAYQNRATARKAMGDAAGAAADQAKAKTPGGK